MTYTPHVWSRHDKLDSSALNNLEQAVGAFSATADEANAAAAAAATSATAAAANAAASATAATNAANLVGAPADNVIATAASANGSATRAAIAGVARAIDIRAQVLSSDAPFATDGTWADCSAVLQRTLDALHANNTAPVQVFFPAGRYPMNTEVHIYSNTGIAGESEAGTIFVAASNVTPFVGGGIQTSLAQGIRFSDFTVDCSAQTLPNYDPSLKAFHLNFLLRPVWQHVTALNSWGTAFGCDYMVDFTMDHVTADGAGRGIKVKGSNPLATSGGSGIGIGTGMFEYEGGIITSPRLLNCGRAGLFGEMLGTAYAAATKGLKVVGGYARYNYIGFQDSGWDGADVSMDVTDNAYAGVLIDNTILTPKAGRNGRFTGQIARNGTPGLANSAGVVIGNAPDGGYSFNGDCHHNIGDGVTCTPTASVGPSFTFALNCHTNNGSGYRFRSSGSILGLSIDGASRNNGQDATAATRNGVTIESPTTWLKIGARCVDTQGTPTQQYGVTIVGYDSTIDYANLTADVRGTVNGYNIYTSATSNVALIGTGTTNPSPGVPLITDNFNRPDNATTLGSTTGGSLGTKAWSVLDLGTGGAWGILNNTAVVKGGSSLATAVVDPGQAGTTIEAALVQVGSIPAGGLAFRVVDANNMCCLQLRKTGAGAGQYALETRIAGTRAVMTGGSTALVPAIGDQIKLVDSGTSIQFWLNNALVATATSTQFNTATKVGFQGNRPSDPTPQWDNFTVRAGS